MNNNKMFMNAFQLFHLNVILYMELLLKITNYSKAIQIFIIRLNYQFRLSGRVIARFTKFHKVYEVFIIPWKYFIFSPGKRYLKQAPLFVKMHVVNIHSSWRKTANYLYNCCTYIAITVI